MKAEWSKAYIVRPRDNINSHVFIKSKKFVPSFQKECAISMNYLIGWEYARIWLKEREAFILDRQNRSKPKYIKNDYNNWLEKRKIKN